MFDTEIIRVPTLPLKMVNAHIIRSEGGCILVDAGIPGSERKIKKLSASMGCRFATSS